MAEKGVLLDDAFWRTLEVRNESGYDVDHDEFMRALRAAPEMAALADWSTDLHGAQKSKGRAGSIFERDRYVTPTNIFDQFDVAQHAVEHDDVVGGVADSTEGLAFSKMRFEAEDEDQEDVWNQIGKNLDLDSRLREMWRELFTFSQVVVGSFWGTKTYTVRGTTKTGVKRKKTYSIDVPLGLTMLDQKKVLPVGSFFFNREKLVYVADRHEVEAIEGVGDDEIMRQLILGKYTPTPGDQKLLKDNGISTTTASERLYVLNPQRVFRHTETRSQGEPFAAVRLKSVFEWLDMKNQLKQRDRAHLIGATNFIVLIKKGTDTLPANQTEVNALRGYARQLAQIPVIVGDHRLNVEIVVPPQDYVLIGEKYNMINAAIAARLYKILLIGGFSAGAKGDDSIKLSRVIARGLESRRHQLKRSVERNILQMIVDKNEEAFDDLPDLRFTPKRIALDFDANMATFMKDLADRGDLSRDTLLSEFDFDQDEEFRKRKREKDSGMDDVFQTAVPFSSPQAQPFGGQSKPQSPGDAGRNKGGTRRGGGAAPGTNQGKTKEQQSDDEGSWS